MVAGLALSGTRAKAQSASEVALITQMLPEGSRAVIARLSQLDELPAETWRYHAGDLGHGEATDLDDSGWTEVKAGSEGGNERCS
jgi:alpha-mannosidase